MAKSSKIIRFLESIGLEPDLFDIEFKAISKTTSRPGFHYSFIKDTSWDINQLEKFYFALKNKVPYYLETSFEYKEEIVSDDLEVLISFILDKLNVNISDFSVFISNGKSYINLKEEDYYSLKTVEDAIVEFLNIFSYPSNLSFELQNNSLEVNNDEKVISFDESEIESNVDYEHLEVVEVENNNFEQEDTSEFDIRFENDQIVSEEYLELKEKTEKEMIERLKQNYENMKRDRSNKDLFKRGGYEFTYLRDLNENSGPVDFNGFIFESEIKDTRTGRKIATLGIDDGTDAVYVKFISNNKNLLAEDFGQFEVGKNIRIKGRADIDQFKNSLYVMGHYFYMLPDTPLRDDNAPEKRVELHLHTNLSEMDGMTSITDYCKLASHMGMKAIAVTDHGVVQAFPEAQKAQKKYGIKVLYGCELYLINDCLNCTVNPDSNLKLSDANFVVFDLESTGLSIRYDRITEFGAVKIVNGLVTDRLDILINPEMDIPEFIQEKTNITNEMVANCPTIKEALPIILKFIGDSVLVSHNIEFDYYMLNESVERCGYPTLKNPCIDTLELDRFINPTALSHRLEVLCKRFNVPYDVKSAHRADYDAEVLSECFLGIRTMLLDGNKELGIKGNHEMVHSDLATLEYNPSLYRHLRGTHCTVYCKNKIGLKNLYKIVSDSHVNHMGKYPLTTRKILEENREGLIVGSACFNGDVFYSAYRRNWRKLEEAVQFCDFIELQPLENYVYLLNTMSVRTTEQLKQYLFDIEKVALEQNKLICATGDCHYLNEESKKYRDIYISIKGIGGSWHPLKLSNYDNAENPNQHFRSTEDMLEAFSFFGEEKAYEYVVTNTNKIADMCETLEPIPDKLYPPEIENCDNLLRELCYSNLHKYYGENPPASIKERLDKELHGIISNGFSVTYYIAHKLVKKSNEDGYIVGSRGSVGSSFAATMADITEVNPLAPHYRCPKCKHVEFYEGNDIKSGFDLPKKCCPECGEEMIGDGQSIPFQTFLGFNAEKVPDIDLNFPADYQSTAHLYTKVLLGEKNVFRAGTISETKFKTAFIYIKKYYESFGIDPNSISAAKRASLAYGCQNVKRTTGQHPGGIVVIPSKYEVYDFVPVQYPAGNVEADWQTTHFDYHAYSEVLLKLDMLGHVDPQALKMMCDLTNTNYRDIPLNDPKTLSIFTTDEALNLQHKYLKPDNGALGIPEFGTNFVRQMLRETQPKTFNDLMIISGLSHGTMVWAGNSQDLVKNGIADLQHVIGCRDDIMTYLISNGIDAGKSFKIMESVRKGKGLTKEQEEDMVAHGVPDYYIDSCKKIQYLFPKGHACAYVTMALRVGYFKVYHPLEYYATFFTLRCDAYDIATMVLDIDGVHNKIEELAKRKASNNPSDALSKKEEAVQGTLNTLLEMLERGYKMENINLQKSDFNEFIVDKENNSIIPPFRVLDGLGEAAGKALVSARNEKMFTSLEDFEKRSKLTKTNIKDLKKLGVLDNLKEDESISLFDFDFS